MAARILFFTLLVGVTYAATWIAYLPEKPKEFAHKPGCYIPEINEVVPFGAEVKPIGYCYRVICGRNLLDYASCGTVGTNDPKCYVTDEDLSRPYPHCCPDVKCDVDNKIY